MSLRDVQLGWLQKAERLMKVWSGEKWVVARAVSSCTSIGGQRQAEPPTSPRRLAVNEQKKWLRRAERLVTSPAGCQEAQDPSS